MAVDAAGAVHIAVTGTGSDNQGIWYLTNATGRWVKRQVVTPWIGEDEEDLGRVDEPALAIDPSDGSVWIAFVFWACTDCYPNSSQGVFYVTNAGGTWSDPVQLTGTSMLSSWSSMVPSLAVRDGKIYLAWATGGDYVSRGEPWFGSNASGAWAEQELARVGVLPHLVLDPSGKVGILFAASDIRYAQQKANGDFVIGHLPGTAGAGYKPAFSLLARDDVTGVSWAAWQVRTDAQNYDVYLASRGPDGWSDPITAIAHGELIGLGVHDGVVQLTADKSGLTYASNRGGAFVEQIVDASSTFWGACALALLPSGRPIVVIARDDPSNRSGLWFLKGPPV